MAEATSTGTAMRQQTTVVDALPERNLRRRRPDQLEHLVADGPHSQTHHDHILEIVTHIFWINAVVLKALKDGFEKLEIFEGFERDQKFETPGKLKRLITTEEVNVANNMKNIYEPSIKGHIMKHLRTLSPDGRKSFILDHHPCGFYLEALQMKVKASAELRSALTEAQANPYSRKPKAYDYCDTIQEYIGQLAVEVDEDHYQLVAFLDIFKELLNSTQMAARQALLSPEELHALRIKFLAISEYYPVAYSAAHGTTGPKQQLLNTRAGSWWETGTEGKDDTPRPERTVFTAYQDSETMRSSLNAIVPIVSLVSVVPAALAWRYGTAEHVTLTDSNFYQAITGSILQLLSLTTFIWPTLGHPRLSRLNWVWIWIMAGFSVVCTLVSPLFYWFVSTTWSFVISFCGAIIQAIIQLQVVNSI